jgi:copper chaperone CopZ
MLTKVNLAVAASALAVALTGTSALARPGHEESATAEAKAEAPLPANAVTATFHVNGMHCPSCELRIQNALHRVNGIYKVDVNMSDKRVVVIFDKTKVSADAIASAITAAGFQASAEV